MKSLVPRRLLVSCRVAGAEGTAAGAGGVADAPDGPGGAEDDGRKGGGKGQGKEQDTAAVVVKLSNINSYTDRESELTQQLTSSEAALGLKLQSHDFNSVTLQVLARKLEVMQWQFFEETQAGADKILVDLRAKKDMMQAVLPLAPADVCLPYGGSIATSSPTKSLFFTSLFGIKFYIQPRNDVFGSDIFVAAWGAKTVSKASECFFNNHICKREFLILRRAGRQPGDLEPITDMQLLLLPPEDAEDESSVKCLAAILREEAACVESGGTSCCSTPCEYECRSVEPTMI